MKLFRYFFFIIAIAAGVLPARASHTYGADFYYTHLGGTMYQINLVIYGDCGGGIFDSLSGSHPVVELLDGTTLKQSVSLQTLAPFNGIEVTPVCPAQLQNTTCVSPTGTIPGVKKFTYTAQMNVPYPSSGWKFRFTGEMANSRAGRSNAINNVIVGGAGSIMVMEADLNNSFGPNSSPLFTSIPTPFFCLNVAQQYNPGPVDPNLDSLAFSLTTALEAILSGPGGAILGVTNASYNPPYSPASPLAASAFAFNTVNGQLSFTPNIVQQNIVVNRIEEYRNGILVGTAMREMAFIVIGSCNNAAPSGNVNSTNSSVAGGVLEPGNIVNVCEGTGQVSFTIFPLDPTNDIFNVSVTGLMTGATANISGNNTATPAVAFSWNVSGKPPGNYTFFITYKDNGCPFSATQTQAYTIRIVKPPVMTHIVTAPTRCYHKAKLQYNIAFGLPPYTVIVKQGGTVVSTIANSASPAITDSLLAGSYTATVSSPGLLCVSTYNFTIVDSGIFPLKPMPDTGFYCLNDVPVVLTANAYPGATIHWFTQAGMPLPAAPVPSTATSGIFRWLVDQTFKVCTSVKDTALVYVTVRPTAAFSAPPFACTRDTVGIVFTGAVGVGPIISYTWDFQNPNYVSGTAGGPFGVQWDTPGIKTIRLQVAENKCPSFPISRDIVIKPTPVALFTAANICQDAPLRVQYNTAPLSGATYAWDFDGANPGTATDIGPHFPVWSLTGERNISLIVAKEGCADTLSRRLIVHPRPSVEVEDSTLNPCLGDKIYLQNGGEGITYTWTPVERIFTEVDGRIYTRAMVAPLTYRVIARNEFDCQDSAAFTLVEIQQCCQFSYPNAFSPNGDGRNDRFRIVTYGNMDKYELGIYNRWGGQVFHSYIQKESWDGMINGEPAEVGTYMYYLRAHCMTGKTEEHKGEIMLIR